MLEGAGTPGQQRRRQLVLSATLELLRKEGYDRTKMQDIAARSGVALATIYSYFGSREYLILVATLDWMSEVTEQSHRVSPAADLEAQMVDLMRTWAQAMFGDPELLRAWARSHLSTDPRVVRHVQESTRDTALGMYPPEVIADPELADDIGVVLEHVWFTGIVRWSLGQKDSSRVHVDAERAMRVVFAAHRCNQNSILIS